jgi:hypothetical protein
MRMKLIRDFETLSKPKKLAVGIFSTAVGSIVLIAMDLSMGWNFDQAITDLSITVVVSLLFTVVYGILIRLGCLKRFERPTA